MKVKLGLVQDPDLPASDDEESNIPLIYLIDVDYDFSISDYKSINTSNFTPLIDHSYEDLPFIEKVNPELCAPEDGEDLEPFKEYNNKSFDLENLNQNNWKILRKWF